MRFYPGAGPVGGRSSRSAPKGTNHRWFSETCPPAAIARFPNGVRSGEPIFVPLLCGVLRSRPGRERPPDRIHGAPRRRQGGGPQPYQTAAPRSRARRSRSAESPVVHRHQSAAESAGCPHGGVAAGSGTPLSALQWLLVGALRIYQFAISPFLPAACRFYPTCSEYMRQSVERYGVGRGTWKGLCRLLRCHPWHEGGFDPVR